MLSIKKVPISHSHTHCVRETSTDTLTLWVRSALKKTSKSVKINLISFVTPTPCWLFSYICSLLLLHLSFLWSKTFHSRPHSSRSEYKLIFLVPGRPILRQNDHCCIFKRLSSLEYLLSFCRLRDHVITVTMALPLGHIACHSWAVEARIVDATLIRQVKRAFVVAFPDRREQATQSLANR